MTVIQHVPMNWRNPDYAAIFAMRLRMLDVIRSNPDRYVPEMKAVYRKNPAQFINDWGVTYDPRNVEVDQPSTVPFILFEKQVDWVDWVIDRWRNRKPGICEKSRDMGVTWCAVALSSTLCLHYDGLAIGMGSRKTEYVDKIGTFKPILPKARIFLEAIPEEFRGGFVSWRDAPFMRVSIPATGSIIVGEGGDDIGRGDRSGIFFFDESAHHPKQELVDAALSQTTNCRIDLSSVRGMNNSFAKRRHGGKIDVFIFDWRDDPRKDQKWYDKQVEELDPVVVAQEIDRDYLASVKGVVIPSAWVRSAIDAKKTLGIAPSGKKGIAFDVADEGADKNAVARCEGTEVLETDEWKGEGSDIFESVEYVFDLCDEHGYAEFRYDADGLGAGVRGDSRVINDRRKAVGARVVRAIGYRGSEGVYDPEGIVEGTLGTEGDKGRLNKDYFQNHKAQSWWSLRRRFQKTHRWVQAVKKVEAGKADSTLIEKSRCPPDEIISLSGENPDLQKLVSQLSQATYKTNEVGKIVIDKKPDEQSSPNEADAVVIHFAPTENPPTPVDDSILRQIAAAGATGQRRARR